MQLVHVLLLIPLIQCRKMPCRLIGHSRRVDQQGNEVGLEVGMADVGDIQVAVEGILVWRSSMIRDLELRLTLSGIVEDIDIAALVETVVGWSQGRIVKVVVNVGEAVALFNQLT